MSFIRTSLALMILVGALPLRAEVWPFDQRQVLLAQIQGTQFPEALTTAQVLDVFVERGRVRWITQQGGPGSLSPVTIPTDFPWNRGDSVRSLGLKYKADGIVVLTAKDSQVDLRWYSVSDGQPLYFESLYLPSSSGTPEQDLERKRRLRAWLKEMWDRIPGQGYVVKRDISSLEIEGAVSEGLKVGDVVSLHRLKDIRRHPVLKTLVGFDSTQTGTAVVTSLGKPFSKARVDYESDLDPIREGDRYLLKPKPPAALVTTPESPVVTPEVTSVVPDLFDGARLFDISPRVGFGFLSYEERTSAKVFKLKTLSFSYGLKADLHLTSSWYGSFQFDQGTGKYGTPPSEYGATEMASGWSYMHVFSGYRMPLSDYAGDTDTELNFFGGYSRFGFKAEELSAAVAPSAKTYSGLDFGVSLNIPIQAKWVAEVGFTRVLGAFLKEESLTSGSSSTDTSWSFWTKLRILAAERSEFGGAYEVYQGSSNFEGTGTRTTPAISAKVSAQRSAIYYKQMF
jgi:hypothetical protein